ncbi:hypothetical protein GGF31_000534 [Allomyces arbusculus]|nr:hypothetical protein GGF31_000534 [Allomyces arbusculus]
MPAPPSSSSPPAYGACLAAACDVLSVMPGQCAPVDALGTALDGPFADVLAELGDVRQLATEFPDHVSYDLISDALALIEHPRTFPPPDDEAVDARRLALRLLSAYHDNEPGVLPAATVRSIFAHHAKHIGQVGGPEAVADAYPDYLEFRANGSVELLDEPPNPLEPLSPANLPREVDTPKSSAPAPAPAPAPTKTSVPSPAATTARVASPTVPGLAPSTAAKADAPSTTSSRVSSPVPRASTTTTAATRTPTPSRDDAPNYVECLRATCELLKKRPAGTATLTDLNAIAIRFPRVMHELMSLKGLSIEFPDHITHNARLKALRVTSADLDSLPPDGYIHRRRRALRLMLAYNGNQLGKLAPAVVQTILDKHRAELSGISTAAAIARAYPMLTRIEPNGDLNLFSFPTRMLEPMSLEDEDEPAKPATLAATPKSAGGSMARATASLTPASRPSTTGSSTTTRTISTGSHPPTTPPSTRTMSAASSQPPTSSSTTMTSPSPANRSKSAVPAHWHPRRSLSRCDIFVVRSASTAWHLPAIVRDANVTKLGVSIEFGADGTTADVVTISFIDPFRVKPLVFVWDFARAPAVDRPLMKMRLQSILREPGLVVVVHGRSTTRDLVRCLDVRPNMLDTQMLFHKWMELTVSVWTSFGDAVAQELGAPPTVNVTNHATLNMVLDACKRPQNEHAKLVSVTDFRRGDTFWDRHDAQGMLLEYTACNADQLVPAAYSMIQKIGGLKTLQDDAEAREASEEEVEEVESGEERSAVSMDKATPEPAPAPAPSSVTAKAPAPPVTEQARAPPVAAKAHVAAVSKSPAPVGPVADAVKEDAKPTASRGVMGTDEGKPESRAPTPAKETMMPPPGLGPMPRKEEAKPTCCAAPETLENGTNGHPSTHFDNGKGVHDDDATVADVVDPSLGTTWTTAPLPKGKHAMARFAADTGALEWHNATGAEADDASPSDAMSHDDLEAIEVGWRNDMEARMLLGILPPPMRAALLRHGANTINVLDELVLDVGRVPQIAYWDSGRVRVERLKQCDAVSRQDLEMICVPLQFGSGNRVGLEGTLHQFSRLLNRTGQVVGLTVRLGRETEPGRGVAGMLVDLMEGGQQSILIAGRSGRDRTTTIRDLASRLAARNHHVLVIDTYSELGGDGDVPHAALGQARRVHVPDRMRQSELISEAVFNHAPDVLVVHDLLTPDDFAALRLAAPRVHAVIVTAPGPLATAVRSAAWGPLLVGNERVFDAAVEVVEQGVARVAREVGNMEKGAALVVQRRAWPWVGREQQPVQTSSGGEGNGKVELGQGMFWVEWERI